MFNTNNQGKQTDDCLHFQLMQQAPAKSTDVTDTK